MGSNPAALPGKIIVIDDDPTGSQTVHSCLLLTRWDPDTLREALEDEAPLFFVLSNTRGMTAARAEQITREICRNLHVALERLALAGQAVQPLLVSRSDSTLRGHYPVETDVIAEELGPFDAHFLVPAFFEGGRITRDSTHYVVQNGVEVPAHETEFARDSVFAFQHSYLPGYVAEKTQGRILAEQVQRFTLEDLRAGCLPRLLALENNACVVVDAVEPENLQAFARDLRAAAGQGKRFLFRSAASLLTALADLPPQPVSAENMAQLRRGDKAGAILVGSHVRKSTEQLKRLLEEPGLEGLEVDVDACSGEAGARQRSRLLEQAAKIHDQGRDLVIFTSRSERQFPDQAARLAFGESVSAFLMKVLQGLPEDLGFLISKGGITSNDVLSSGLALRKARVMGQILPGCSVVLCPPDHPRYPDLPVVIFPGNVGDVESLAVARQRLRGH
ncbi:four-carbon acid sugar kinase family protein [Acidithiobacillus montserratensis]|uniref:Four-carbon acid sugar kinase family protein n=1 Tax=Acidithiobacillus montserratensis TaxID=2729135 RepID=A0ACD5HG82_9PROT